jgi:TRAP-type transport system periplasmic protein
MNKARYEAMPADLRAILDKHSGMAFAQRAGKMWDEEALRVLDTVKKRGNTIGTISEEEKAKWISATAPVHTAWIEQMKTKGIDGAKLIDEARALVAKYEKA